jgi:hypothetical protein
MNHVKSVDVLFYWWGEEAEWDENSTKWETYVYLRKCLLDYQCHLPHEELTLLIAFLEIEARPSRNSNKNWLAKRLLDKPKSEPEEHWNSGMHEWLERSLIIPVLKRSAGMEADKGIQSKVELGCMFGDVDWLSIQATCRSADKYISFKKISADAAPHDTFFSGHCGNLKRDLFKPGFATEGSTIFHHELVAAFNNSTQIVQFVKQVINIYRSWLISGRKTLVASPAKRFLSDGTETNDPTGINHYRLTKHKPNYKEEISRMFAVLHLIVSKHGEEDDESTALIDSDSSSDEENVPNF